LADDRYREIEIRRCGFALGVKHKLVLAGRSIARQRHRGLDVLRLAGLDRDTGELLATIGLGKGDLKVFRRVSAEIDRRITPAVVSDRDLEFEGGRSGAPQCREVGRELELRRKLLSDRNRYRQFQRGSAVVRLDHELVITGPRTLRRLEAQLQFL